MPRYKRERCLVGVAKLITPEYNYINQTLRIREGHVFDTQGNARQRDATIVANLNESHQIRSAIKCENNKMLTSY